jgi:hypothetical protein
VASSRSLQRDDQLPSDTMSVCDMVRRACRESDCVQVQAVMNDVMPLCSASVRWRGRRRRCSGQMRPLSTRVNIERQPGRGRSFQCERYGLDLVLVSRRNLLSKLQLGHQSPVSSHHPFILCAC